MKKKTFLDVTFLDALKQSTIEIMGESIASQVLTAGKGKMTAERWIQEAGKIFHDHFGLQSARGLLVRIGRSAAGYLRQGHHAIMALGTIEKRLSPILNRFETDMGVLLSVISPEIGMKLTIDRSSKTDFLISINHSEISHQNAQEYPLFLLQGLFEGFGNWLDSRKDYEITILDENERQSGRLIKISIKAAQ